jgi:hypothetical protein
MTKLISILAIKQLFISFTVLFSMAAVLLFGPVSLATAADEEVAVNVVLTAAQAHTPGKVVAHEKADEQVGEEGAKTLQPVYRVKILSEQGVMKTVLVLRQTGQVIE